jgi:hypothetical protein
MNRKLSILLAVLALVVSSLACAAGEPTLGNVRTATDQDGNNVTTVFSQTDTVYVVSDLSNGAVGNVVSSKWYAVDVADTEPNLLLDEVSITIDEAKDYSLYFYFEPPVDGQWPVGSYKVEVYFNGVLNSTVAYTVQ